MLGVLLAFLAGSLFGVNAATLGAMLLVALLAGRWRGLSDEPTTAAATGLVVLLTGYSEESGVLAARLADTAIGIGVGGLVKLAVWAPLRHRSAARQVDAIDDRLGALLTDMAEGLARAARPTTRRSGSAARATSTGTSTTPGRWSARRGRAAATTRARRPAAGSR